MFIFDLISDFTIFLILCSRKKSDLTLLQTDTAAIMLIPLITLINHTFACRCKMSGTNPCITCGACCAYFRVSFYWAEADDGGGVVPSALTEQVTPLLRAMRGTNQKSPRCVALAGTPGSATRCTIYSQRPSPCREFACSGEGGEVNEACDRARARYGLPPLKCHPPVTEGAREPSTRVQLTVDKYRP
jgi:Fe-S-cluster containining protein